MARQVAVTPVSLGEVYQIAESKDSLNVAYVPETEAIASATNVLDRAGRGYEGGVPLFVSRDLSGRGYLTFERNSQKIIPFFFDLEQLEASIAKFKAVKPELANSVTTDVIPLEDLIEVFETNNDPVLDRIVLVPTSESIEFLEFSDRRSFLYRFRY